ncbi:MAG: FG-GAP repeat protein [Verrucomicrobiales bacterium]|nr:FG-GAP repeat protein [Verrucomicrobiales bacterium]
MCLCGAGTAWSQQAYLKASNTGYWDHFGSSVAVDGDTVVVGAPDEDSSTTGVNSTPTIPWDADAGAAYVFVRSRTTWSQQAYLKAATREGLTTSVAQWLCLEERWSGAPLEGQHRRGSTTPDDRAIYFNAGASLCVRADRYEAGASRPTARPAIRRRVSSSAAQ